MNEIPNLIPHYIMQGIFFLAGAVCFIAALSNAKWFFESKNIDYLRKYFNRTIIRIIYATLGIALMTLALYFYYNLEQLILNKSLGPV